MSKITLYSVDTERASLNPTDKSKLAADINMVQNKT